MLSPSLLKKWGKEMACNFISCDSGQKYLLPPSLREWLPEGDLAWFILDEVEQMEVEGFYKKHRSDGCGRAAFGAVDDGKPAFVWLLYGREAQQGYPGNV